MNERDARRLRLYHFGATLVAIGIALWALFWVQQIRKTTATNLTATYCNQGLLTLATLEIWLDDSINQCPSELQITLREKYR